MFKNLSDRLAGTMQRLRGKGKISDDNIKDAMREVRVALLEADVALPVVTAFTAQVKEQALGAQVLRSIDPGQAFVKIVHDELVKILGSATVELNLDVPAPAIVLMAGLQGAGKTTTVGKLARLLVERQQKKVMVVSCDIGH